MYTDYTLVDFTTSVKGTEYLIAIAAIFSFILFAEILKANPFKSLMDAGREDIKYVKEHGFSLATLISAPIVGLRYVLSIPLAFVVALAAALKNGFLKIAGGSPAFSWRPMQAYFSGQKKAKRLGAGRNTQSEKK